MIRCKIMATLAELYEFLEKKQDDKQIDSAFSYEAFSLEERSQARLEIFSWWEIERLVEDENCLMDKSFAVDYCKQPVNTVLI